jgi:hypothetical protein
MSKIGWNKKSLSVQGYEAICRKFSLENNGEFVEGKYGNLDGVELKYKHHTIIIDRYYYIGQVGHRTYDTELTRVRLEFKSPDELRFSLTKQGFLEQLGKLFGLQDIQVGDEVFDKRFLIKGNDEFKIQTIFSNLELQELLLAQSDVQLQLIDTKGIFDEPIQDGNVLLYYLSETLVEDTDQMNDLLRMYQLLINQFTKTSSIERKKG